MYYTAHYDSPLGGIRLVEKDGKLAGLWFDGQKYYLGSLGSEKDLTEKENSVLLNRTKVCWTAILEKSRFGRACDRS